MYLLNKYLKCSVGGLALRYDIYIYMSLGFETLSGYMKLVGKFGLPLHLGVFVITEARDMIITVKLKF